MSRLSVPSREQVSQKNQATFDQLQKAVGLVPSIYAVLANSETALGTYLAGEGAKTSLNGKEKEVIDLAVSQVNACDYCLSAHVFFAKHAGFSTAEIHEIRQGKHSSDAKLNALAGFAKEVSEKRGHVADSTLQALKDAGYSDGQVADIIMQIGYRTITNLLQGVAKLKLDWAAAPAL